jgi:diacylglycerol O-acyltransferase-1
VLSSSHIILRNFDKYGLLIDPREWFYVMIQVINYSSAVLLALIWLFPALTFIMEVLASKFLIKEKVLFVFHTVNLFIFIITPVVVAFVSEPSPAGTFIVMLNYAIVWMKMVSYCHVNKWCRLSNNSTSNCTSNSTTGNGNSTVATGNSSNTSTGSKSAIVTYPNNLNVKDFIYFLFAPTLCYELNFPSSPSIRKMFLIRRTLEAVFLFNVLLALSQQWLAPTMLGSVEPFQKMNFIEMIQRILLLALPNHLMWLLMFYFFFHSFLNMLGEVMRFGDRCFYKDWWNADSISSFWRHWNVPVHRWASRSLILSNFH